MNIQFKQPKLSEFSFIKKYIAAYQLDNRALAATQFIAAFDQNQMLGFGRLRLHTDCTELCSLAVVKPYRRKGIGKNLVKQLIANYQQDIYLVCIIPEFFTPFGFQIVPTYPASIAEKLAYCKSYLVVPQTYVAMQLGR
jgi:N-acetylglutamate synthase-like GNAT family acetyltransferase